MSLRTFINALARQGELRAVEVPVATDLEISAIVEACWRLRRTPSLMFTNAGPRGGSVVTNLFASEARVAGALGAPSLAAVETRLWREAQTFAANGYWEELAERIQRDFATQQRRGPCVHEVAGLDRLPALRHWEGDAAPYLTAALTVTRSPDGTERNVGLYRVMLRADGSLAVRWRKHSGAERHAAAWHAQGLAMPIGLVLGAESALMVAAAMPLPQRIDEFEWAGYLQQRPLTVEAGRWVDLELPSEAEWIIEGTLTPGATCTEGPFGNYTGRYDRSEAAAWVQVAGIRSRSEPCLPAIVVGPPPLGESGVLLRAGLRLLRSSWRWACPEIEEVSVVPDAGVPEQILLRVAAGGESDSALRRRIAALPGCDRMPVVISSGRPGRATASRDTAAAPADEVNVSPFWRRERCRRWGEYGLESLGTPNFLA